MCYWDVFLRGVVRWGVLQMTVRYLFLRCFLQLDKIFQKYGLVYLWEYHTLCHWRKWWVNLYLLLLLQLYYQIQVYISTHWKLNWLIFVRDSFHHRIFCLFRYYIPDYNLFSYLMQLWRTCQIILEQKAWFRALVREVP